MAVNCCISSISCVYGTA